MLIVRGRAWSWAHMVAGAYRAWARIGRGRVSVVGAYRSWARIVRGRVSVVSVYRSWASLSSMGGALSSMRDGRPWVVGRGVVVVPGRWVSFEGAGCCSCALGALVGAGHRSRAVGRCRLLWALGLLRVGSLLGVLSLLGVGSLLGALVVLGLSWDGVDVVTYRDVTTNDDFRSSFVVQLPRRCQRRGTCERYEWRRAHLHSSSLAVSVGGLSWL